MRIKKLTITLSALGLFSAVAAFSTAAAAGESITSAGPQGTPASELTDEDRSTAISPMPMLEAHQLPLEVREMLQIDSSGVSSEAYGSGGHPFTTKRATTKKRALSTIKQQPYASTGKLWMRKGGSWYVCTASLIDKGVLVTAAHCVWDFGASSVDVVEFEPARHASTTPYGVFTAADWAVPAVYSGGTDVCDPSAPGIVCENDVAVVILNTLEGMHAADTVEGKYSYQMNDWGYVNFADGKKYAQITQFGYPVSLDAGYKMIRTDSIGYQATPYNVVIGSDQTGGSSGGPWIMNFGVSPVRSGNTKPLKNSSNRVVATTSWGYTDNSIDIQGASRFSKNTTYTTQSNIEALHEWACTTYPANCY